MKIVLGWLLPGGAYLLRKRYEQFAFSFALVCAAFVAGIGLGGLNTPAQPEIFGAAAAVAKWLIGGPYLIARMLNNSPVPIDAPMHDYGLALLMAAGLINLLALSDTD